MNDNDAVPAMNAALLDDLRRQNLALKEALKEATARVVLCCCMDWQTLANLRQKWALLIGDGE